MTGIIRDETRLPIWAQAELRRLRQDVEYWREHAEALALPDAPLVIRSGVDTLAGFLRHSRAEFHLGGGCEIDCYLDLEMPVLHVSASRRLVVLPRAANAIDLEVSGWTSQS